MLYGIGWIAFSGTSIIRFIVITFALIITLMLGYIRFARTGKMPLDTEGDQIKMAGNLDEIERRIRDLEIRMNDAAKALGKKDES